MASESDASAGTGVGHGQVGGGQVGHGQVGGGRGVPATCMATRCRRTDAWCRYGGGTGAHAGDGHGEDDGRTGRRTDG